MTDDIKDWLNSQHAWIQEAAHRLLSNGKLSDTDITYLVTIIKNPPAAPGTARTYPNIGAGTRGTTPLRLNSIGSIQGIDALNPRNPLTFGSGNLTVVYGDNGSGKSGYTRILKKACGKPKTVDLKPNAYKNPPASQQCDICYEENGTSKTVTWIANTSPVPELETVDIFDSQCGRIYIENDTELSYTPAELTLFENLVKACKTVEAALTAEQSKLVSRLPDAPAKLVETDVIKAYSALIYDISDTDLKSITTWTGEDADKLKKLRERFQVMDSVAQVKKKRDTKSQVSILSKALSTASNASNLSASEEIKKLLLEANTKRLAATEGAKALGDTAQLEGIGSSTWQSMWQAAREYSIAAAYPGTPFPHSEEGAKCVLCHQSLDEEAQGRLRSFEAHVTSTLETDAKNAEKLFDDALDQLPTRPSNEALDTASQASELSVSVKEELKRAWIEIDARVQLLKSKKLPETIAPLSPTTQDVLATLAALEESLETEAQQIEKDSKTEDRTIIMKAGLEMAAREWVSEQSKAIESEITRLQNIEDIRLWKKEAATNKISLKAGKLSKELITDAYIDRFNTELVKLGASHIQVELKKTTAAQGIVKHAIFLKGVATKGKQASEVLSEGENRIVALAAYLADVTSICPNSPFIFDDPISSLDQRFEEKTIARLIELTAQRQVIVFTHRLSFLGIMEDKLKGKFESVHIRREPWGTGETGSIPLYGRKPDSALSLLLNNHLQTAEKTLANDGSEAYYPLGKSICSDFRIIMERIVEFHILADVVQRHRRAVNTMGKIRDLTKITHSDCDVADDIMGRYSAYEHSQSFECPTPLPTPDELRLDLETVIKWLGEFNRRQLPAITN